MYDKDSINMLKQGSIEQKDTSKSFERINGDIDVSNPYTSSDFPHIHESDVRSLNLVRVLDYLEKEDVNHSSSGR